MKPEEYKISKDLFVLRDDNQNLHDEKLKTKPVGYFKDALYRFTRNKASIVAFFIIALLVLFAVVTPFFCQYKVIDQDEYYAYALPKSRLFSKLGIDFWDGCSKKTLSEEGYYLLKAIAEETGYSPIKGGPENAIRKEEEYFMSKKTTYTFRYDSYYSVGVKFVNVTLDEYKSIQEYQDKNNIQIIYPITDLDKRPTSAQDNSNANYWFKTKPAGGNKTTIDLDANGNFISIYTPYSSNDNYTSKMRIEKDGANLYDYARKVQSGYEIRVCYYNYYRYLHEVVKNDNIKEPLFLLGATNVGRDILASLSNGARFSFILSILVATVNLIVGAIIGAIEGYYGGLVDLIIERFNDVLGSIPFMVVISLLKFKLDASQVLILFISFFATGWMGMAARTRMQFYRFKNREYVLVARTLGAKDGRVMFKHIFPNAIGTLITSCVLVIPSVIFSETSLSYLGIINLETSNITSVGTLLAKGQAYLFTYPHMIVFPALFISLLMLSFNLFGNGLRDAFNPSLRGTEE